MSGMGTIDNKRGSAALPVAALRSAALPRAALPASGLWRSGGGGGYWPGGTPGAIRSACVLWYDISRQGCTNESMAADPTLRDLSGNGHDAACHGFGWTEESGISTVDYPNALVGDGVDDYAKAEGLPLLDKERGYTVIAKRKHLGGNQACLASRRNSGNTDGAFVFELKSSANSYRCDSFNTLTQLSAFEESDITCQTSQRYNDTAIGIGDAPDNGVLNLFVLYNSYFGKIALYSFLLFDRNLTAGEIAWVRENLLGDAPRLLLEDGGGISLEGGGQLLLEG